MAYTATHNPATSFVASVFQSIGETLTRMGQAAFVARGMEARMHQYEKMRRMSDAELAELGLQRDGIAAHVFRDFFYD